MIKIFELLPAVFVENMKFSYASKTPPLIIYKDARKLSYLLLLVTKLSGAVGISFNTLYISGSQQCFILCGGGKVGSRCCKRGKAYQINGFYILKIKACKFQAWHTIWLVEGGKDVRAIISCTFSILYGCRYLLFGVRCLGPRQTGLDCHRVQQYCCLLSPTFRAVSWRDK